jgi:hypothetical protein
MRFPPKLKPYDPPEYDERSLMAIRALWNGTANAAQQADVRDWLQYITGTGAFADLSFRPGGAEAERETAFAEGKKFVGLQLLKMLHPITLEAAKKAEKAKPKRPK